jgi:hypothetical protein
MRRFIWSGEDLKLSRGPARRVQIPVSPIATSRLLYELLGRERLGFLVVSPFRIACKFLHWERGQSSKRVWRSHRIIYFMYSNECALATGTLDARASRRGSAMYT